MRACGGLGPTCAVILRNLSQLLKKNIFKIIRIPHWLRLAVSEPQEPGVSAFPVLGLQGHATLTPDFYLVSKDQTQLYMLVRMLPTELSLSFPSLKLNSSGELHFDSYIKI